MGIGLPEGDHGAEVGGVGCCAAGEQAGELEALELRPEEEHGEHGGEGAEDGHAHADGGEVPVAEVGEDHEDDGGGEEEAVPGVVDCIEGEGEEGADADGERGG